MTAWLPSEICRSRGSWVIAVLRRLVRGDSSARTHWHLDGRPVRNEPGAQPLSVIPPAGISARKLAGARPSVRAGLPDPLHEPFAVPTADPTQPGGSGPMA